MSEAEHQKGQEVAHHTHDDDNRCQVDWWIFVGTGKLLFLMGISTSTTAVLTSRVIAQKRAQFSRRQKLISLHDFRGSSA